MKDFKDMTVDELQRTVLRGEIFPDAGMEEIARRLSEAERKLAEAEKALDDILELCELSGLHNESEYLRIKTVYRSIAAQNKGNGT